jgi:ribonuclease HI
LPNFSITSIPDSYDDIEPKTLLNHINALVLVRDEFARIQAKERIHRALRTQVRDPVAFVASLNIGDKVVVYRDPSDTKSKTRRRWDGPYFIIGKHRSVVFLHSSTNKVLFVHGSRVRLYEKGDIGNVVKFIAEDYKEIPVVGEDDGEFPYLEDSDLILDPPEDIFNLDDLELEEEHSNSVMVDVNSGESAEISSENNVVTAPFTSLLEHPFKSPEPYLITEHAKICGHEVEPDFDNASIDRVQEDIVCSADKVDSVEFDNSLDLCKNLHPTSGNSSLDCAKEPDIQDSTNEKIETNDSTQSLPENIRASKRPFTSERRTHDDLELKRSRVSERIRKRKDHTSLSRDSEKLSKIPKNYFLSYCSTKGKVFVSRCQPKKRHKSIPYTAASIDPKFLQAMQTEVDSFVSNDCIEIIHDLPLDANVLSSRWILTEKKTEAGDRKPKARLVVRGFEDTATAYETDAPTMSNTSERVILAAIAAHQFEVFSIDFQAAFQQGNEIQRDVYVAPPKEFYSPGTFWKLKKPIYGLKSAPRSWYDRLEAAMKKVGFVKLRSDNCVFILFDSFGLCCICGTHVDDMLGGGRGPVYEKAIRDLKNILKVGSESKERFHYNGGYIQSCLNPDGLKTISLDQHEYIASISPLEISEEDRRNVDRLLNPDELHAFRSITGSLLYTGKTCVNILFPGSVLSSKRDKALVKDAILANRTLTALKESPPCLKYLKPIEPFSIKVFADASFANRENGKTQAGFVIMMASSSGKIFGILDFRSHIITRVCRSTLTAETLALSEALDAAMFIKNMMSEIWSPETPLPIELYSDSKSIYDLMTQTTMTKEKRIIIDISSLREDIRNGSCE